MLSRRGTVENIVVTPLWSIRIEVPLSHYPLTLLLFLPYREEGTIERFSAIWVIGSGVSSTIALNTVSGFLEISVRFVRRISTFFPSWKELLLRWLLRWSYLPCGLRKLLFCSYLLNLKRYIFVILLGDFWIFRFFVPFCSIGFWFSTSILTLLS